MNYVIRGARVVGPKSVTRADMLVEDGRLAAIGRVRAPAGAEVVEAGGLYALPGFVDLHTHGGLGFDVTTGMYDLKRGAFDAAQAGYDRMLPAILKRFARCGVTRTLLATLAAPDKDLCLALSRLADYIEKPENGREGARLEGSFIEGTFIRHPERAGAQNPANFRPPQKAIFDRYQNAARGTVRYVNIVPDFGAPAVGFVRHLTRQGVLAGAGHTACEADQFLRCVRAGCRTAVHFMNGSIGSSFKPFHGGNAVEAILSCDDLYAELICDGFHVNPAYVLDAIARKGADRIVLVTDAVFAAGAKGIRRFTLAGIQGELHPSGRYLRVKGNSQVLFGSVLDMATAAGNVLSWLTAGLPGIWYRKHAALPLNEALVTVARAAATNPAHLIGLDRVRNTGSLEPGRAADLILADLAGRPGAYKLNVKRTFVDGRRVA